MDVKFESLTLTTNHPASSYGLGVVLDESGKVYMPNDFFEYPAALAVVLGIKGRTMAEQLVLSTKSVNTKLSEDDISQLRKYLSQHPNPTVNEII